MEIKCLPLSILIDLTLKSMNQFHDLLKFISNHISWKLKCPEIIFLIKYAINQIFDTDNSHFNCLINDSFKPYVVFITCSIHEKKCFIIKLTVIIKPNYAILFRSNCKLRARISLENGFIMFGFSCLPVQGKVTVGFEMQILSPTAFSEIILCIVNFLENSTIKCFLPSIQFSLQSEKDT